MERFTAQKSSTCVRCTYPIKMGQEYHKETRRDIRRSRKVAHIVHYHANPEDCRR